MTDAQNPSSGPVVPVDDHYFHHLCDHAGVAMISTDTDLVIKTWNAAASKMFGASSNGMVGTGLMGIIPAETRETAERVMRKTIVRGDITHFEFRHRDAQGQPRTLAVAVSPVVEDDGRRIGALACVRDITRRIQLEGELAKRDKMSSLGSMAGRLAHHFNNILGGIVTSVDFALVSDDPHLQRETLKRTSDALARASKLIEALLAFAEGDRRHSDVCDLTEAIIFVANYVEKEFTEAGITLEMELGAIPVTTVPRVQIITVLENVLHNCVDALEVGGKASLTSRLEEDGVVVLTIADNGCGMEEEELRRAFEPFFSTKSMRGGDFEHHPGLGLAVAHGILEDLGHTILVKSVKNEGTTVTIRFSGSPPDVDRVGLGVVKRR
jgi:PAS domain S-box-containing protein